MSIRIGDVKVIRGNFPMLSAEFPRRLALSEV
jgi:hypothetical protein